MSALRKVETHYTYADYAKWDTDERFELIDGVPYAMASPSWKHQQVLGNLHLMLGNELAKQKQRKCRIVLNFDTRLKANKANKRDDTVVQPDLAIICDPSKISENSIIGAPDFVVEILPPSNSRYDLRVKFAKYREAGVREIWFIDPYDEVVFVYWLNGTGNEIYAGNVHSPEDKIPVRILPDFFLDGVDIFEDGDVMNDGD
ncbi:MAG: Uma2 family endonuclease [Clostridiales bacterium]|jgi:Uma2 family endonuclease|nr:Uma2 family endonuclease [Clostridiales bacterium]